MPRILLTGASGQVGQAVQQHFPPNLKRQLLCATRNREPAPGKVYFDFADLPGSRPALAQAEVLFLLRPPQLADVEAYFAPLIKAAEQEGVSQVVFLSVQGADQLSIIPHAKIEKLLRGSQLAWTFVRPSYFMQNLSSTLRDDIRERDRIFLPAGRARFLWIDVDDIGRAVAAILANPMPHAGQAYDLTGEGLHDFATVADLLSRHLGRDIRYQSPNLLHFIWQKRKEGHPFSYIFVLILLHYFPRFSAEPEASPMVERLTGGKPGTLEGFIKANRTVWEK